MVAAIPVERARRLLVHATRLDRPWPRRGRRGAREVLDALGQVQIDPIDRVGTNPDLVFHARVDGYRRGDWGSLGGTFEHFAKERCLLPVRAFPAYRQGAGRGDTGWWRQDERLARLDGALLERVLAEVRARGPLAATELDDLGRVEPIDWNGWASTGRAGSMALEALWSECRLVVVGRTPAGARLYDLPERALARAPDGGATDFETFALLERVRAAGFLCRAQGPQWSMLRHVGDLPDRLLRAGTLVEVRVEGSRRSYLCLPTLLEADPADPDDRMRILGPLDALVWDRKLVQQVFDFDYVWEVYKPAHQRRWGYYVCPLLHRGRLVGRLEAVRRKEGGVDVIATWGRPERRPLRRALERLVTMLGGGRAGRGWAVPAPRRYQPVPKKR